MPTQAPPKFPQIRDIRVADITIPVAKYQRDELDPKKIERLAENWTWPLYDPIKVYRVAGESAYQVYQGGHRVRAAIQNKLKTLPATVFDLSDLEAAQYFNDQDVCHVAITRHDHHKTACYRGEPDSLAIDHAVTDNGYALSPTTVRGSNSIRAVGSIYAIARRT